MNRTTDKEILLQMSDNDLVYVNWSEGSGGEVWLRGSEYTLVEITQCGCEYEIGKYTVDQLDAPLDEAYSWT
jgi:hypothetical protein